MATTINYIEINPGFDILIAIAIVLALIVAILIIRIPIVIAKNRGITGGDLTTIGLLSWLGIFFGVTWVVALILAFIWSSEIRVAVQDGRAADDIDRLEKLHKLKKSGAISQKEFDTEKKKVLGQ